MRAVCPRGAEFGGRWPPRGARAAGAGGGARAVELQRDERLHRLLLLLHILVLRRQGAGRSVSGLALNAAVCATRPDARRCKGCRATACTSSSSRISSSLGGVASLPCSSSVQFRSIADMAQASQTTPRQTGPILRDSRAWLSGGAPQDARRTVAAEGARRVASSSRVSPEAEHPAPVDGGETVPRHESRRMGAAPGGDLRWGVCCPNQRGGERRRGRRASEQRVVGQRRSGLKKK